MYVCNILALEQCFLNFFVLGAVHKGRPQRREEGVWSNADTCGQVEVKDLADVRKLVGLLFFVVSACFADTLSVDDAY